MANEDKKQTTNDNRRCEDVALRLYAERSSTSRHAAAAPMILQCFKDAQTFLDIARQIQDGSLTTDKPETRLSDASAPNLPHTHPMNLISQRFVERNGGNEEAVMSRIRAIVKFLEANPTLGKPTDGVDLPGPEKVFLEQVSVEGGEPITVNWTVPDLNTARLILPPLVKEQPKEKAAATS
jgi:hypothetical protein